MPQIKKCTVDELLRNSLIEFSLKHNNKTMFELLTGENWRNYVVKENKVQYQDLHNEYIDIEFDFITCPECQIKGFNMVDGYCLNCGWDYFEDWIIN